MNQTTKLEALCKLRDGAALIADAAQLLIDEMNPEKNETINIESIPWVDVAAHDNVDPYQCFPSFSDGINSEAAQNIEYKKLLAKIKEKGGYRYDNLQYWLFRNNFRIGRRPIRKK